MKLVTFFQYKMTSPVNCFQTMVWTQFAVTVHGYVTKHTHNIICLEKVDNSEHKNHENKILIRLVVINQTEIVKLASGIVFCLLSCTSYLSEPTSTEAGTADKLSVSHFSELLAALWTSNWTLIFNANTRPVLFQNYSTPSLWFFKPCWLWFLFTFPWLCWLLTVSDNPKICGLSTRLGTLHWKYSPYSFIHEIFRYNGFDSLERICQFLLRDMLWYSTNIQQSSLWDLI